jgi:hypothetical protein
MLTALTESEERSVRAAIRRGIAILQRRGPRSWKKKLSLQKLRLYSADHCVLGQVYGDQVPASDSYGSGFEIGLEKLNIRRAERYAFETPRFQREGSWIGAGLDQPLFNKLWREELKKVGVKPR